MFRQISLLTLSLSCVGCAADYVSPGRMVEGATSAIYTTVPAQAFASCLAAAIGTQVQNQQGRFVVNSVQYPSTQYSIGVNPKGETYPTQIAVIGTGNDNRDDKAIVSCLDIPKS